MRGLVAIVGLLCGCDRVFGLEREYAPPDARLCFGKSGPNRDGLLEVCPPMAPPLPQDYDLPQDVDTDGLGEPVCTQIIPLLDGDNTEICVLAARNIHLRGAPSLHGGRPLVLVATHVLTVEPGAVVDVASHDNKKGPGTPNAVCADLHGGASAVTGGGGGAGGGFGGEGPRGGNAASALGGDSNRAFPIGALRPGCAGGRGGNGTTGGTGGPGGDGGGALYLIAGERIEVFGSINASGAGGRGGAKATASGGGGGGGGGGTGGVIGLDSAVVVLGPSSALVANGGGGGAGGGAIVGVSGTNGEDPMVYQGVAPFIARGGTAGTGSGMGGRGGAAMTNPAAGSPGTNGGGGGAGGAVGVIRIYVPDGGLDNQGAIISPPHGPP